MLTHKDFDFDSMRSKTLNELTKEEKEYISKYVSMKIPHQFYQYVVSYVQTDAYIDSSKKARVHGIYTTFGEAYDGMVEFFDLNESDFEEDDVETIAGLVVKLLGKIADVNDSVSYKGLTFTVVEVDGARITKLHIYKEPQKSQAENEEEALK